MKFGRRKTAPANENAPSDNKPIFYGTRVVKTSNSMIERNTYNKPMVVNTQDTHHICTHKNKPVIVNTQDTPRACMHKNKPVADNPPDTSRVCMHNHKITVANTPDTPPVSVTIFIYFFEYILLINRHPLQWIVQILIQFYLFKKM